MTFQCVSLELEMKAVQGSHRLLYTCLRIGFCLFRIGEGREERGEDGRGGEGVERRGQEQERTREERRWKREVKADLPSTGCSHESHQNQSYILGPAPVR